MICKLRKMSQRRSSCLSGWSFSRAHTEKQMCFSWWTGLFLTGELPNLLFTGPVWVTFCFLIAQPPTFSFSFSTTSDGQRSLPQHLGTLPEPLLIFQTNYRSALSNSHLTDPHSACSTASVLICLELRNCCCDVGVEVFISPEASRCSQALFYVTLKRNWALWSYNDIMTKLSAMMSEMQLYTHTIFLTLLDNAAECTLDDTRSSVSVFYYSPCHKIQITHIDMLLVDNKLSVVTSENVPI